MKNSLEDLHNYLMIQVEALGDPQLRGQELRNAISRANATANVANKIIENSRTMLDASKLMAEYGLRADGQSRVALPAPLKPGDARKKGNGAA